MPEEWCDGFWPGILWMDYQMSHDNAVRTAAEGYTNALRGFTSRGQLNIVPTIGLKRVARESAEAKMTFL